jgi:serine/threonine protein kinase
MHRRSIFHNNLNLDNILLCKKGSVNETYLSSIGLGSEESDYRVKIIDWGNARCSTNNNAGVLINNLLTRNYITMAHQPDQQSRGMY